MCQEQFLFDAQMHKQFFKFCRTQHVNSAAGSTTTGFGYSEVCVQKYSHDSTLGKGEVLHQDVETSVLIIEELPDPPVTQENRAGLAEQQIKNTPLSFGPWVYPLIEKGEKGQKTDRKINANNK